MSLTSLRRLMIRSPITPQVVECLKVRSRLDHHSTGVCNYILSTIDPVTPFIVESERSSALNITGIYDNEDTIYPNISVTSNIQGSLRSDLFDYPQGIATLSREVDHHKIIQNMNILNPFKILQVKKSGSIRTDELERLSLSRLNVTFDVIDVEYDDIARYVEDSLEIIASVNEFESLEGILRNHEVTTTLASVFKLAHPEAQFFCELVNEHPAIIEVNGKSGLLSVEFFNDQGSNDLSRKYSVIPSFYDRSCHLRLSDLSLNNDNAYYIIASIMNSMGNRRISSYSIHA